MAGPTQPLGSHTVNSLSSYSSELYPLKLVVDVTFGDNTYSKVKESNAAALTAGIYPTTSCPNSWTPDFVQDSSQNGFRLKEDAFDKIHVQDLSRFSPLPSPYSFSTYQAHSEWISSFTPVRWLLLHPLTGRGTRLRVSNVKVLLKLYQAYRSICPNTGTNIPRPTPVVTNLSVLLWIDAPSSILSSWTTRSY